MLPGLSMEDPVQQAISTFHQLCPGIEEIYAKPKEEEEELEEGEGEKGEKGEEVKEEQPEQPEQPEKVEPSA